MTSLQELAANITADAMTAAQEIEAQLDAELSKINAETQAMVGERRQQLYAQAQQREQELKATAEAKRKLEAMQQILRHKQQLLDETFAAAEERLAKLKGPERKRMLELLWKRASSQIAISSVQAAKQDAAFFRAKKVKVSTAPGLGGFIAIAGKVQVDLRFETLLLEARSSRIAEVTAALWGKK
jgi:vacuolar-type H+-ATPase subunit E/Vma4